MDEQAWHYLGAGARTAVPRRHIFLACDGQARQERKVFVQKFGAAAAIFRSSPKGRGAKWYRRGYDDTRALWADIDAWCKPKHRTVLWSWDLSAVVRLAQMFQHFPPLGWGLTAWSLQPQGTWMVWANGNRTLTMVEVTAFFPTDWPGMVSWFERAELVPLDNVAAPGTIMAHCARVAQTVHNGVVDYLARIEREDLGAWQITGTGQAFSTFRHRHLTHDMLVHWDLDARDAERRAMWAGRTEAYWHGTLRGTRVDEWDMTQAYPRIARDHPLPVELCKTVTTTDEVMDFLRRDGYAVLAEITVSTDVPVVPASFDGRILWPVGQFSTTVWDPELRLLRDVGGTFTVSRAWVYRSAPALASWGTWICNLLDDTRTDVAPWVRAIAKFDSRAVVGRFGMQHDVWEELTTMPHVTMRWWTQRDAESGQFSELVHVGRTLYESTGKVDWSMSIPAVPSWVASQCRANLTRVWLAIGDRVAVYADTDSLFAEGKHAAVIQRVARRHPEYGLRLKRSWRRITIMGPRQLITGDRVRASGVPVRAQLLADGSLVGEVRESLRGSILAGRTGQVRITPRRWRLREVDRRRSVGPDGWTVPVRLPG